MRTTLWTTFALLVMLAIALLISFTGDILQLLAGLRDFVMNPDTQTGWFLLALVFLPLLAIPFSLFCIMAGVKFGFGWGMLVIGITMFLHLLVCYAAMHSYFKPLVRRQLDRRGYRAPILNTSSQMAWGAGLVAAPVLPYMVKNVLLASGSLPLRTYLAIGWPIQLLNSVPFVMFSGAVKGQNLGLMWVAVAFLALLLLATRFVQQRLKLKLKQ